MMDIALPIRRMRLELDRTLRSRAFFGRATTGRLHPPEYLDLLMQLTSLVSALSGGEVADLQRLGSADADALRARDALALPRPCQAVVLAREVTCEEARGWGLDAALAVIGTSWAADAAERLSPRFAGSTRLLTEVADRSRGSVDRLAAWLGGREHDPQTLYAFTELARGAVLGMATYLDSAWPPPVAHVWFDPDDLLPVGARGSHS